MSDKPNDKTVLAVTVVATIIAAAIALGPPGLNEERPRHKGGRRRKKTWMEKQQRKRGWGDKY